jgi:hypothetical protein
MGAANRGAVNRQTVSVRIVQPRSIDVRSLFIVKNTVVGHFRNTSLRRSDQKKVITWQTSEEEKARRAALAVGRRGSFGPL